MEANTQAPRGKQLADAVQPEDGVFSHGDDICVVTVVGGKAFISLLLGFWKQDLTDAASKQLLILRNKKAADKGEQLPVYEKPVKC